MSDPSCSDLARESMTSPNPPGTSTTGVALSTPMPTSSGEPVPASDEILAQNLSALAGANPRLAECVRAAAHSEARFTRASDGNLTGDLEGRPLASRHRPLDEADALVAEIDLAANATLVVLGFALGHHIRRLGERMGKAGLVVVYEPNVGLLRDVLSRVDHSEWIRRTNLIIITDIDDRGEWAGRLAGLEPIIVQGVRLVEHPASRGRLGDAARRVGERVTETVRSAKMSMATTLVRSVATGKAYLGNIALYAAGNGCAELKDLAAGRLGIVVSAGPSLRRNVKRLAEPGVSDRCVIVATQTTLKPLLEAGVRPHFVCALDWHHISKRFYEGIRAEDVAETTLILDPQANPIIAESYPGPVRVFHADFLHMILARGESTRPSSRQQPLMGRDMGRVQTGNTVAHLCHSFARWLGCDPVALIGQDLGFTDGLYYARGTAIDEVWSPELNPFNTIEMMEWQRIMRHKHHLRKVKDIHGRSIYTDSQMEGYLNKFESMFAADCAAGRTTIDATEGGVAKSGTEVMSLADTLERYARSDAPRLPVPRRHLDAERLRLGAVRVRETRRDVLAIQEASEHTTTIIAEMLEHQLDARRMKGLWPRLARERKIVEDRLDVFNIINHFNQLGVFKRTKADRKLHFAKDLSEIEQQKAQLERDLSNVRWTADAAKDLAQSLDHAVAVLEGRAVGVLDESAVNAAVDDAVDESQDGDVSVRTRVRASFLVPIDPARGGSGAPRALDSEFGGRNVLQRTLERLGRSNEAESIVLLVPDRFDPESLIQRGAIGLPIEIERCGDSVFGPEREAIIAARLWSDTSWRGGIAGMSVYDEIIAPEAALKAMERLGLTAAVFVGPDWPCIQVDGDEGCDALVRRHREAPDRASLAFTQSPPGLCGILLDRGLVGRMVTRSRLGTIGGLLVYQPHLPQPDPIALDICVPIDHRVRCGLVRAIFDTPRQKIRMRRGLEPLMNDADNEGRPESLDARSVVTALENQIFNTLPYFGPQHVQLELCTGRASSGVCSPHHWGSIQRTPMTLRRAERLFSQLAESGDAIVTLGGVGDPLHHPDFDAIITMAKESGVRGVHVRTELLAPRPILDRLLASPVDVISVDLHADTPATYRAMLGVDRFEQVIGNLQHLFDGRRHLAGPAGRDAIAMPWICPRLQRRLESYEDIDPFFERWSRIFGTPILEGPLPSDPTTERPGDPLATARPPARVAYRELHRRMTVLSDGAIPVSELDLFGEVTVGNIDHGAVLDLWRVLVQRRRQLRRELGPDCEALRIRQP